MVVGDTPFDIACARAAGARVVAVATGGHTLDELRALGPDLAVATSTELDAVLRSSHGRLTAPADAVPSRAHIPNISECEIGACLPPGAAPDGPRPLWYRSFYWRIAVSFIALVIVVLVGQSLMFSYC